MTKYTYSGDETRYYPALGITATPGLIAEFDEPPADGRWIPTPKPAARKDDAE